MSFHPFVLLPGTCGYFLVLWVSWRAPYAEQGPAGGSLCLWAGHSPPRAPFPITPLPTSLAPSLSPNHT